MALKIAFFDSHSYDETSFAATNADYGFDIQYYKEHLSLKTVPLAKGADVVCTDVVRPRLIETTALGAAFAAGLSVGLVQDLTQLRNQIRPEKTWSPRRTPQEVAMLYSEWNRAVERTYDWE